MLGEQKFVESAAQDGEVNKLSNSIHGAPLEDASEHDRTLPIDERVRPSIPEKLREISVVIGDLRHI